MDIEAKFGDLGVDAITGVKLMRLAGIYPTDFYDEQRFFQFKDVIDYFKDKQESLYIINKITAGKPVDKLVHIWGYVEMAKQKEAADRAIASIQARKDALGDLTGEDFEHTQTLERLESELLQANQHATMLADQIHAYEK